MTNGKRVTQGIAEYLATASLEDFPTEAVQAAKGAIIDCLACMLAGSREPLVEILIGSVVRDEGGSAAGIIGAVYVHGVHEDLGKDDLRLLYTVGDLVSIAIERARLFARSVRLGTLEERNRLAREIHDTLAQGLVGIALRLETAEALLETEEASVPALDAIRHALSLTRANLEEARRSVLDLRAAPLAGRSLADALTRLVEQLGRESGLEVHLEITGGARPLPVRLEVGLYRIVQERLAQ